MNHIETTLDDVVRTDEFCIYNRPKIQFLRDFYIYAKVQMKTEFNDLHSTGTM